ncbi:hypothetical protein ABT186_02005 [Streptomyces sp. NPDC001634]|uniref:hypothetical protein n=1 Tax=Streptomyces sp. NPDC001634 TaxID=3154390 RepID=UPI00332D6E0A
MSARDDLYNYADDAHLGGEYLDELLDRVEKEAAARALSDAVETARGEYLTDATGDETDEAYNRGVADVIAAIDALKA